MFRIRSLINGQRFGYLRLNQQPETKIRLLDTSPGALSEADDPFCSCSTSNQKLRASGLSISFPKVLTLTLLSLLSLGINVVVLVASLRRNQRGDLLTPVFHDFPSKIQSHDWDLAFYTKEDDPAHIYRKLPSPAVDKAWKRIAHEYNILVDREDIERSGVPIESAVRAPASLNLTEEKYVAAVDSQHQIHCLDAVRKSLFSHYYYEQSSLDSPYYIPHLMHCLDIVRQSLMCHANTDLLVYAWVEDSETPFMSPTVTHQCSDFEKIMAWQEERDIAKIDKNWLVHAARTPDTVDFPMQKEWYDLIPAVKEHRNRWPELYENEDEDDDVAYQPHNHQHHHHPGQ